jgi:DNA mismatch repair ATPase MutS
MQVDKITLQDIGLFNSKESISVATHLNFCKTNGGQIHFEHFLTHPLSSIDTIVNRQDTIGLFIKNKTHLEAMSITNGTSLVIEKLLESAFAPIPKQAGLIEAYWYTFWNKADFALIKYSVEHLVNFILNLKQWAATFEDEKHNSTITALVEKIKKVTAHPSLVQLKNDMTIDHPSSILQLSYFFIYQYKTQTKLLLSYFYEIDAYYSMATAVETYHFNFPTWANCDESVFEVEEAFHPLLSNPISNQLSLSNHSNLLFLTGANMAGKSTFIKTIGIVIYLAHVGMGVPAKKASLSLFDGLITNLTIADNIVKGESYFFNEVQRIKNTIEKIIDGKKYFVLIDELFKGTNIQDAMKCSTAVIEGLQNLSNSLFLLSTHLYEISDGLKKYSNIQFSYFETEVHQKELIFHYQLKQGVSQDRLGYLILEREGVVDLLEKISKTKY